ncbi:unnamed protein product [Rangifer tarandus platyrhynchus]|uniref:Uncharacterized protein n=1 Tax=Rangifer tarandus platyrhynchus TaxID=3082113 RepID=A0AC59ZFV2_RANTA
MWAQKIREVVGGDRPPPPRLVGAARPCADGRTREAAEWPEGVPESRSQPEEALQRPCSLNLGSRPRDLRVTVFELRILNLRPETNGNLRSLGRVRPATAGGAGRGASPRPHGHSSFSAGRAAPGAHPGGERGLG